MIVSSGALIFFSHFQTFRFLPILPPRAALAGRHVKATAAKAKGAPKADAAKGKAKAKADPKAKASARKEEEVQQSAKKRQKKWDRVHFSFGLREVLVHSRCSNNAVLCQFATKLTCPTNCSGGCLGSWNKKRALNKRRFNHTFCDEKQIELTGDTFNSTCFLKPFLKCQVTANLMKMKIPSKPMLLKCLGMGWGNPNIHERALLDPWHDSKLGQNWTTNLKYQVHSKPGFYWNLKIIHFMI